MATSGKSDGAPAGDPEFSSGHPARPSTASAHSSGHSHGLEGPATATGRHRKRLIWVLAITLGVFVVQVVGALISNSLALLADSLHMLTDATGIFIALVASVLATLPATSKRTFGLMRVEVLAALANGIILGVIAVFIFIEAIKRFGTEVEVQSTPMLIAAVIGAVANLVSLLILQSAQKESLNVRGAYLEVLGDLLGSVAVIIAGVIILFTGWMIVDQLASILIAVLIAPRAYSLLRDVVRVLLEASPKGFDMEATREHIRSVPGVVDAHDLHAWTITSGVNAFSAHVIVDESTWSSRTFHEILDELHACLSEHFDTEHCTIQLEPIRHARHEQQLHD
ncbi:MAG: cation diffusion facilitator family transporter [Agrococcus casei]|uniref:cation diffusion facilitator family transporter n=1 Tax=Agrococcus casei TaxID=343512 RepID=UPI003F92146C